MSQTKQTIKLSDDSWVDFWADFCPDLTIETALIGIELQQQYYKFGGKPVPAPRLTAWQADSGRCYTYSRNTLVASGWQKQIKTLSNIVSSRTELKFNSCLLNYYRDGNDSISWHADDEPEVGPTEDDRWVASISLGQTRLFVLRALNPYSRYPNEHKFSLPHGSLLVMRGRTQSEFQHAVPKEYFINMGPRLNLTFRHMLD